MGRVCGPNMSGKVRVETYTRGVEFSRRRPNLPDKLVGVWFGLHCASTDSGASSAVMDPVVKSCFFFFQENIME
jgi:hypothetical protein